ncbi:MAG: hypothetical protein IPN18_18595 [Ignavibacteriales bacterium]|nr:hypothetical protein [Ignavibacteriales bacterium]
MPPTVKLSSPNASTIISEPEEQVEIEIFDEGGGIDELRLYQNGKLIDVNITLTQNQKPAQRLKYRSQLNWSQGTTSLRQMHLAREDLRGNHPRSW